MLKTYDYTCQDCELDFIGTAEYEQRDEPQECPCCKSTHSKRVYRTANMRTAKLSRTFVDGQRKQGKEWQNAVRQQGMEDAIHEAQDFSETLEARREYNNFMDRTYKK